ncbi:hemerythrin domain-containing protein [Nocardioides mangrovicus]|uniref:Hemerythrin domain-containing protein n=1 Tax=Nocardioides mangrovicus TaxID=2478913 RepID=A0A3L8P119_9ACTN|nr:hemerythrin domain-containing protein [Nocardioides mangrovicus]RLV48592.1 hemerythrin domain-containing protein [Nocardioides mangrovicus]
MTTPLDPQAHHHTRRCWYDHREARWNCSPQQQTPIDVRDMIVVHTMLLREFRLVRDAVAQVGDGDARRAEVVDRHLGLLCDLLHHHHAGEDELLWPVLRPRLTARQARLLDVAEAQHAALDAVLGRVRTGREQWVDEAAAAPRRELVEALEHLHALLAEHLRTEEEQLLPLAALQLTQAEWDAVGEAGAASVPKAVLPLVFGMFAYEGDPAVLSAMLASAPAVPRYVVPRIAPTVYARRARQVYGTATP